MILLGWRVIVEWMVLILSRRDMASKAGLYKEGMRSAFAKATADKLVRTAYPT